MQGIFDVWYVIRLCREGYIMKGSEDEGRGNGRERRQKDGCMLHDK